MARSVPLALAGHGAAACACEGPSPCMAPLRDHARHPLGGKAQRAVVRRCSPVTFPLKTLISKLRDWTCVKFLGWEGVSGIVG